MNNDPEDDSEDPGAEEPNSGGTPGAAASVVVTGQLNITDVLGLGQASQNLRPVGKSVANAFNKFFAPTLKYISGRAEGAARRHEALADAKALQRLQGQLVADTDSLELVRARFLTTEIRRQSNIDRTLLRAVQHAESQSADDAAHAIDEDFMAEWVDGVKDVSKEDVQQCWARILAEAPKSPAGRVQKPVLDLLRQFDHVVAQSFADFTKLYIYSGAPSAAISESWSTAGVNVDFQLLEDIGAIQKASGVTVKYFNFWEISQSGKMVGSNLRMPAVPSIAVWRFRHRALGLAKILFPDTKLTDEDFGYRVLGSNLRSFADDVHQHLRVSMKCHAEDHSKLLEISHPENAFLSKSSDDESRNELVSDADEMISEIRRDCEDIPGYALRVLADFANEGRLRILSID